MSCPVGATAEPTGDVTHHFGPQVADLTLDTTASGAQSARSRSDRRLAVSGGDYGSVSADPVTVTIVEVSAVHLPPSPSRRELQYLQPPPASNVTISVSLPSDNDLSIDLLTLTFTTTNWATPQAVTVTASEDDDAVTDDAVLITHTMSSGGSAVMPGVRATITEKDSADLVITPTPLTVTEGDVDGATYTVALASEPTGDVTVTISGHSGADLSLDKTVLTFTADDWDTAQTVKVTAAHDDDAADDPETLTHTASGGDYDSLSKDLQVTITDDAPATVTVSFGADRYTIAEGGTVEVTVTLDVDPERTVTIPLTATNENGATNADYSGVPQNVTFDSGETSKSFTFSATDDTADDDDERVKLAFGTLPTGITTGTIKETVVSITDDDAPGDVKVSFGSSTYTVVEGASVTVTLNLDVDPERTVVIPVTATNENGATNADYSGVPNSVTFESGDTSKTFTFSATDDTADDDDERVKLAFGTLPTGITTGTIKETTVSITDDDAPGDVKVSFGSSTYTVAEGAGVTVTLNLDVDPERTVTIPLTATNENGATNADYSGVPQNVTFDSGETSKSFTFSATRTRPTTTTSGSSWPSGRCPPGSRPGPSRRPWSPSPTTTPPGTSRSASGRRPTRWRRAPASPSRWVWTWTRSARGHSCSPPPTRTAPPTPTTRACPSNVTFESGETSKSFTFSATEDTADDDDERVKLAFGTLPTGITTGTIKETVVSITDDDAPGDVKVSFGSSTYTVAEGASVTVTVGLDVDPEHTVVIPVTATNENGATNADYSGVPNSVTFESGETSKDITFSATDDSVDDDGESVQLSFGSTLPTGVTEGTPGTTTVSITDDDLAGDRLASLVVAPKDIDGFDPEVTDYMVGVTSTVSRATITATPGQTDSTVTIDGTEVTAGSAHAVDLSTGLNTFEVVVTSADNDQTTYTVYVGRGTTDQGGWKAGDDLDTLRAAGNTEPSGIWSNGTTVWIADVSNAKLYAYSQAGGGRDGDKDIALGGVILAPTGIWSDRTTIWVIGPVKAKLFAYTLGSGARDSDSDISLGSDLMLPVDMWSDGVTMWVLDSHNDKLYAYPLSGEARDAQDSDKDIDLAGENAAPRGVWSNGTTIWVSDRDDRKLYAYNFSGERVTGHDIDLHSRNADAGAIWGNGDALWVANDINDVSSPFNRVFTYNNVAVTVTFEQSSYTVAESDDTSTSEVAENAVEVKVILSADPKRQVVVPITATNLGNATGADYSGVPANLTFESGETEKSFTFTATHDTGTTMTSPCSSPSGRCPQGWTGGQTARR